MDNFYSTQKFQTKKIVSFIDDLILNNIKNDDIDYSDFDDIDKHKLASMFLQADDRRADAIVENENADDLMGSIICILRNDSQEARIDLVDSVQKTITEYYEPFIKSLIDDRLQDIVSTRRFDRNKRVKQDRMTGDLYEISA